MQTLQFKKIYSILFFAFFSNFLNAETRCEDIPTHIQVLTQTHISFPNGPMFELRVAFVEERLKRTKNLFKKNLFAIPLTQDQQAIYDQLINTFHQKIRAEQSIDCQELVQIYMLHRSLQAEAINVTKRLVEEKKYTADLNLKVIPSNKDKFTFQSDEEQKNYLLVNANLELLNGELNKKSTPQESLEDYLILLTRNHLSSGKTPSSKIYELYLESFAQSLDPHAAFFNKETLSSFMYNLGGESYSGIGAMLGVKGKHIKVSSVVKGGSADALLQKAKTDPNTPHLKVDDVLLAISQDGTTFEDTEWADTDEVVSKIKGENGTTVYLKVLRLNELNNQEEVVVPVVRSEIRNEEALAKYKDIKNNGKLIRVLDVSSFYDNGDDEYNAGDLSFDVAQIIKAPLEGGNQIDGLVLDLRNNGGGSLVQAINIVHLFTKKAVVVKIKSPGQAPQSLSDNEDNSLSSHDGFLYKGPLVVLINDASASASEIVAGALQDYGRALIVGTAPQSFGKGSVQRIMDLSKILPFSQIQGAVKNTTSFFYLPSGRSTQYNGVSSDVLIGPKDFYTSKKLI